MVLKENPAAGSFLAGYTGSGGATECVAIVHPVTEKANAFSLLFLIKPSRRGGILVESPV
jgi:hypothetical protein